MGNHHLWWILNAGRRGAALICLVLSLLASASAVVAQGCQVPGELMGVARTLAVLPADRSDLPPAMTARLGAQLDSLSEARILDALTDSGMDSVAPVAINVLAEAERLANGGQYNPARLSALLRDLDQQTTLACVTSGTSIFQRMQSGRDGGVFSKASGAWSEIERRAQEEKLFAAGAVVVLMVGFISLLVLIDTGYRWIMALLYNRKACRIAADLEVGGKLVEGLVITLGKGGCRFHPLSAKAFDAVLPQLRGSGPVRLRIEGEELQVQGSGIHELYTDFLFLRPITLKQQRDLLEHSSISPYHIRKARDGGEREARRLVG
ncbi:hypothetical protein [Mameliella alba]|uniref:hypothetical protein n=1 Tax=Mameliella alba TaxID=561184 RepID=UPI000883A16A|nr:hypothetical protein [Mameliella alba]MBY6119226.1 hypothetical protein [Mameliella alba]OWV45120.1 hypothetical protein CDZ95_05250 [Mameliella alba]OWV66771.1 hypothetical protein CDZ97_06095 [Mameliella alba]PTR42401.1 hypothetical protein LX94_00319 [Mameliella alba]SDC09173.1 hypothetical protein SAMN05216376_101319 [Mameliella alba]